MKLHHYVAVINRFYRREFVSDKSFGVN